MRTIFGLFLFVMFVMASAFCVRAVAREKTEAFCSLSEVVLFGLRSVDELRVYDAKEGRLCVAMYLDAVPPESPLWVRHAPLTPEDAVILRRRNLKEQMVALLGEKVRGEATSFAAKVPLAVEWEGMSEGPLEEADFAEQWLQKYPETLLADFLHLFMAHRLRASYEAARYRQEKGLRPVLTKRYREALARARYSKNALMACIADDLEAQPHVYLEGQGRP